METNSGLATLCNESYSLRYLTIYTPKTLDLPLTTLGTPLDILNVAEPTGLSCSKLETELLKRGGVFVRS